MRGGGDLRVLRLVPPKLLFAVYLRQHRVHSAPHDAQVHERDARGGEQIRGAAQRRRWPSRNSRRPAGLQIRLVLLLRWVFSHELLTVHRRPAVLLLLQP